MLDGLIDWGDAWSAIAAGPRAVVDGAGGGVHQVCRRYGFRVSDELDAKLAAYRIGWNIDALGYESRAGGDWFDVYRVRIAADVTRL